MKNSQSIRTGLFRKLGPGFEWPMPDEGQGEALSRGIRSLQACGISRRKQALAEQPFDSQLLSLSKLYRRNRQLYLDGGGKFQATLVTSPRSLSSPILMEQRIEYSPIERELVWAACDPLQRQDPGYLLKIRTYSSSVFHEQSHRILWRLLPPPPPSSARAALRRYLNFAESLVIAADMALGDELGPRLAPLFYLTGVTYDPGTTLRQEGLSRREYRNYLQAAVLGTYMTLELYSKEGTESAVKALFPSLGELGSRAVRRSGNLDVQFVTSTNQDWQRRYARQLSQTLQRRGKEPLILSDDPLENWSRYLIAEKWFELAGL